MTYRVEHSKWEDGSGYSYTEPIAELDVFHKGDAAVFADDYISADPHHSYSGDKFEIINNETDAVVDEYTVE